MHNENCYLLDRSQDFFMIPTFHLHAEIKGKEYQFIDQICIFVCHAIIVVVTTYESHGPQIVYSFMNISIAMTN